MSWSETPAWEQVFFIYLFIIESKGAMPSNSFPHAVAGRAQM